MAEASGIVSAAPGMLPIIIEVIKGFGNLCRVVEIANSCTKQLEGIYAALRVLEQNFLNECELTFEMVSPGTQPPVLMTKDLENPLWTDDALEARIRTRFSGSYEQFTALIEALRGIQVLLQTELSIFDDILKEKQNVCKYPVFPPISLSYSTNRFSARAATLRIQTPTIEFTR